MVTATIADGKRAQTGRSMIGAPWWATVLIGVVTVVGSGVAAWIGATRTTQATRQRESAAAREEWFRRLQWASPLALEQDERSRTAGLALLEVLAQSPLAGPAELNMLSALNDRAALEQYRQEVHAGVLRADDDETPNAGRDAS